MVRYILYAEDDQDDYAFLKQALQEVESDIELINVSSGYELIKFLQDKNTASFPGLIVLDMKMPMLDGKETVDLLQLDDRFKTIPVVLFSGSSSLPPGTDLEGEVEIITKPSKYEEWLQIARKLVGYCPLLLLAIALK